MNADGAFKYRVDGIEMSGIYVPAVVFLVILLCLAVPAVPAVIAAVIAIIFSVLKYMEYMEYREDKISKRRDEEAKIRAKDLVRELDNLRNSDPIYSILKSYICEERKIIQMSEAHAASQAGMTLIQKSVNKFETPTNRVFATYCGKPFDFKLRVKDVDENGLCVAFKVLRFGENSKSKFIYETVIKLDKNYAKLIKMNQEIKVSGTLKNINLYKNFSVLLHDTSGEAGVEFEGVNLDVFGFHSNTLTCKVYASLSNSEL